MSSGSRVFHLDVGTRPARAPAAPAPVVSSTKSRVDAHAPGIVAGLLAPHPPHLIYAENHPNNEPRSRGGWEQLRWGYEAVRLRVREIHKPDVILVHAPHWITAVGHHVNCVPNPKGVSVDPIFPHLFRYHFDFRTDVELAEAIVEEGKREGLAMSAMKHPGLRVDYATIASLHLLNPSWDIPVVSISANNNPYYYADAPLEEMEALGTATRRAIEATGRRAVLAGSCTLSHLHWDVEPDLPEDMAREHPYNDHQYRWDMKLLELVRSGRSDELRRFIPEHIEATAAETKAGSLTWMLSAIGWPRIAGQIHAYGSVIGTGNALIEWTPPDGGVFRV